MEEPKVFISYCWSSPEHVNWVLDLATQLRDSGVDAILDKWDLKEGGDAVAFMEKMVSDPEIKKVIIVSDQKYVEKSDGRKGGVGTEAQIISGEIYSKQDQNKFVVAVKERDEKGKPYLPVYYNTRIYIDFTEADNYNDSFEQLLRWIFDKPLYFKPEIGKKPSYLENEDAVSLGTSASCRRAIDAIKNYKPTVPVSIDDYFNTFVENLERFRITEYKGEFDDAVIKSIEDFLPYRNETIQIFEAISQYDASEENITKIHKFFENLIPYMFRPENVNSWEKWDYDNFRFIIHELFLYSISALIKHERFELVNSLLEQKYYLPGRTDFGNNILIDFSDIQQYAESLEYRNQRLNPRRLSVRADLLKERCNLTAINFDSLMQSDFILYFRAEKENLRWWPETLLYCSRRYQPFEIFVRAISQKYFDKIKCILGVGSLAEIQSIIEDIKADRIQLPRWQFESIDVVILTNFDKLATTI